MIQGLDIQVMLKFSFILANGHITLKLSFSLGKGHIILKFFFSFANGNIILKFSFYPWQLDYLCIYFLILWVTYGDIHILRKHFFFIKCNIFPNFLSIFLYLLKMSNYCMKILSKCNVEEEILLFWQKNPVFLKKEVKLSFVL